MSGLLASEDRSVVESLDCSDRGVPCFVHCVDCGRRLTDGLVGAAWSPMPPDTLILWHVVPRFPVAQYGPPAPDYLCRCPDCFGVVAGTPTMDYQPEHHEGRRDEWWYKFNLRDRIRAAIVAAGKEAWWET